VYHNQDWKSRWHSKLWAEAEQVFVEVWPDRKFEKRGNDRTEIDIRKWSAFLRYMPDFLDKDGWIECKGFGNDRIVKIKDETRMELRLWAKRDSVRMFLWDRKLRRWTVLPWEQIDRKLRDPHSIGVFDGKKPWRGLHVKQIDALEPTWHQHVQKGSSPDQLGE
jgi:hypothetical protein